MKRNKRVEAAWMQADPDYVRESRKYDNPIPSRRYLLGLLEAATGPLTAPQLLAQLDVQDERTQAAVTQRLRAMLRDGQMVQNRRGALGPAQAMHSVAGRVIAHRDGFGFLVPDAGGEDIFLPPRQMRALMHGDRALVRVTHTDQRGRLEGSLVDVLERGTTQLVGRFQRRAGVGTVVPDNPRFPDAVLIAQGAEKGAKPGQIVTVSITEPPTRRSAAVGEITEVLGAAREPGMEIDIAIRSHDLPHAFSAAALQQAKAFGSRVNPQSAKQRLDLRALPLVTIDGADSRDFDDAVCAEPAGQGWRLWVAIADVAHYVRPGDALDAAARERGNSVYFPQQVIPMLPEALSNGLCSLNPEVDRLCLVAEMRVEPNGRVSRARFHQAVMRSHARLTYDQVAAALAGDQQALKPEQRALLPQVQVLHQLFAVLLAARQRRGALDFDTVETRIVFDEQRKIERIEPVQRNDAHKLIEECMITANVQAAKFLDKHKLLQLYRVHEGPSADKLTSVREFLGPLGLSLGGGSKPGPKDYHRLLETLQGRADAHLVQTVLLRSLSQAVYQPENHGHFGLSLSHYGHFTSPIRRYPDLMTHRAIHHVLDGGQADTFPFTASDMQNIGAHCSMTERRADDAVRDAVSSLKCEYMQDRVGEEFRGRVTGVVPFGLFVELEGIHVEGLIHVSTLANDYYQHDARAECLRGQRSGTLYRLTDELRVRLVRVDADERKIDFELVTQNPAPGKAAPSRKRKRRST